MATLAKKNATNCKIWYDFHSYFQVLCQIIIGKQKSFFDTGVVSTSENNWPGRTQLHSSSWHPCASWLFFVFFKQKRDEMMNVWWIFKTICDNFEKLRRMSNNLRGRGCLRQIYWLLTKTRQEVTDGQMTKWTKKTRNYLTTA